LFKGTRKRSARQISQAIEGIGGYLNAFTTEENTCFYAKARHDHFREVLDVLTDMFLNSKFDPGEINKERSVIKEELAMYLDQPQHHVQELLDQTLWPNHPLGRPLTGSEKTLDAIKRSDLVRFQQANYVSGGTLVAAAGNVRHDRVVEAVTKMASRFPGGRRPAFVPVNGEQKTPRLRLFCKDTEQTQLALGVRICSRHDERRYPLRLLNTILGENMSSRLFQVVREDCGLAYSIYSFLSYFDDVGALTIAAGLDTQHLDRCLKLIFREMRKLVRVTPSPAEVRRARDYIIGQLDLSLESTENQMMWLGEQLLGYGRIENPDQVKRRLMEVKGSDVRRVAADFLRPERISLALVTPRKSNAGLMKLIRI
jgi:predicted Zn-dependent peptidase